MTNTTTTEQTVGAAETAAAAVAATGVEATVQGLVARVRPVLDEAQKGLQQLEAGAQQAVATLSTRVEATRAQVLAQVKRFEGLELRPEVALQAVSQRAVELQAQLVKQLQELSVRVTQAVAQGAGLATQQQVAALKAELAEVSGKLEALLAAAPAKKGGKGEGKAA